MTMSDIQYTFEERGDIYILRMSGSINAQTLPQYRKIVDDLMKDLDVRHKSGLKFIVDYGGIEDVDSAALANILDRLSSDVRSDHTVVFTRVPEKFKDIVELHKMEGSVRIYPSEDAALRALED